MSNLGFNDFDEYWEWMMKHVTIRDIDANLFSIVKVIAKNAYEQGFDDALKTVAY